MIDAVNNGRHPQSGRTHCDYGHALVAPNLHGGATGHYKLCLACQRTHWSKYYTKRCGRPFDFQLEADKRYHQIMGYQ